MDMLINRVFLSSSLLLLLFEYKEAWLMNFQTIQTVNKPQCLLDLLGWFRYEQFMLQPHKLTVVYSDRTSCLITIKNNLKKGGVSFGL